MRKSQIENHRDWNSDSANIFVIEEAELVTNYDWVEKTSTIESLTSSEYPSV